MLNKLKLTLSIVCTCLCFFSFMFGLIHEGDSCIELGFEGINGEGYCYNEITHSDGTRGYTSSKGKAREAKYSLMIILGVFGFCISAFTSIYFSEERD